MNRFRPTSLALTCAALLVITNAAAQPDAPSAANQDLARKIYLEGEAHYAAGRYRDAVASFEHAHQLCGRPELLFNLGNAYEQLGEFDNAAARLRRYLSDPRARGTEQVRRRIARLEAASGVAGGEVAHPSPPPAAHAPRARPSEHGRSSLPAYLALGVGAVTLASAVTFALLSRSASNDAAALCSLDGYCPREAESPLDRERGFAIAADVTLGVSIAAAATGLLLLVRDVRANTRERAQAERAAVQWLAAPISGGANVGVVGKF